MKRIIISVIAIILAAANAAGGNGLKTKKNYIVGFYNLENLFDVYDDPVKNDAEFLPDGKNEWTQVKYEKKLHNMATVIAEMAKANKAFHTILGISEIENRLVIEDLIAQPELIPANFQIVHYDGPDRRGVDVALLYRPDQFTYLDSESIPYTFEGSSIDFVMTKEQQDYFKTRDVLMVHGLIDNEHFAVYVAHLPSRAGGKKGGNQLRDRGAEIIYNHAQTMEQKYPGIKIVVMGDMNDDPYNDSMVKYLRAKKVDKEVETEDFFNPFWQMLDDGYGSLAYRDVWCLYDMVIVNEELLNADKGSLKLQKSGKKGYYGVVFKRPFMVTQQGPYKNYPFRTFSNGKFMNGYSDHFPTYIVIGK